MTYQNNSVQNQGHKQHVIVNMFFFFSESYYRNIVNMIRKIIEHPIYNNHPYI